MKRIDWRKIRGGTKEGVPTSITADARTIVNEATVPAKSTVTAADRRTLSQLSGLDLSIERAYLEDEAMRALRASRGEVVTGLSLRQGDQLRRRGIRP